MFFKRDGTPKRLFGKIEWPLVLLFSTIPALMAVAIVKNVILA